MYKYFLSLIIIDQLSKYTIRHTSGFYICNSGISFGLKLPSALIFLVITLFLLTIIFLLWKKHLSFSPGLALIASGAISNLLDRLYWGCVTDFIDLKVWPVFNLADTFIFLGFVLLFFQNMKKDRLS